MLGLGVLAVTAGLCVVLVPAMDMLGAAAAMATAITCRTLGLIIVLRRTEGLRVASFGLPMLRYA